MIGTQYRLDILVRRISRIFVLYVGFVTMFLRWGIPFRRGEIFRLFLSPPMHNPALGYLVSRYKLVVRRWSRN